MVQSPEKIVSTEAERYLLVYMISALLIIVTMVIVFFIVFQKRKNKILMDKFKQQRQFEEELAKTQLEIQEQTLKNVGRELHDNVGQMLAYANMQLNALGSVVNEEAKDKIDAVKDVVKDSIDEVRALSKTLNNDISLNLGLVKSIQNEIDRINNLNTLSANLTVEGVEQSLPNSKDEIFIYRIIQEFISNTIKYAKASTIDVTLQYTQTGLQIEVVDDGIGFDEAQIVKGSGLINMENRAKLINAEYRLSSETDKGTRVSLNYKF